MQAIHQRHNNGHSPDNDHHDAALYSDRPHWSHNHDCNCNYHCYSYRNNYGYCYDYCDRDSHCNDYIYSGDDSIDYYNFHRHSNDSSNKRNDISHTIDLRCCHYFDVNGYNNDDESRLAKIISFR